MAIAQNVGLFRVLGIFGIGIILFLWLGGAGIGLVKSARTGDWNIAMQETGGRLFAIDVSLNHETEFLMNPDNTTIYENVFHLGYAFTMLFLLFVVGFLLFKFFNWIVGIRAFSPGTDIMIVLLIIIILGGSQFLYTHYILNQDVIPLTGVYNFVKNLPAIFGRITL